MDSFNKKPGRDISEKNTGWVIWVLPWHEQECPCGTVMRSRDHGVYN